MISFAVAFFFNFL